MQRSRKTVYQRTSKALGIAYNWHNRVVIILARVIPAYFPLLRIFQPGRHSSAYLSAESRIRKFDVLDQKRLSNNI
jgi:hypothetical protein